METLACVIHEKLDLRVEPVSIAAPGPGQVLVRVGAGGICGSDLGYYLEGAVGTIVLREPMVVGHEVAGTVEAVGPGVTRVKPGERVALNPAKPCGKCKFCLAGESTHCLDMWYWGSAMRMPHSQGAFRQHVVAEDFQCEPIGDAISLGEAACAEPLAVALHAIRRAGDLAGQRVLVSGAGSIGSLAVAAARYAGALEVIAVDLHDAPLARARRMGATETINVAAEPDALQSRFSADKGYFDVAIECTGVGPALRSALAVVRPRGTIVQVGMAGEIALVLNAIVAKEIDLKGAFRFQSEYALAARLIKEGRIDVKPIISATLPMQEATRAFDLAADRRSHMKVLISFE